MVSQHNFFSVRPNAFAGQPTPRQTIIHTSPASDREALKAHEPKFSSFNFLIQFHPIIFLQVKSTPIPRAVKIQLIATKLGRHRNTPVGVITRSSRHAPTRIREVLITAIHVPLLSR